VWVTSQSEVRARSLHATKESVGLAEKTALETDQATEKATAFTGRKWKLANCAITWRTRDGDRGTPSHRVPMKPNLCKRAPRPNRFTRTPGQILGNRTIILFLSFVLLCSALFGPGRLRAPNVFGGPDPFDINIRDLSSCVPNAQMAYILTMCVYISYVCCTYQGYCR